MKVVPGFTFMWQSLHRPVVPFMVSGVTAEKLAWNEAWAHSFPWMPATVEGPAWVWQKAQSKALTFTSAWVT